VTGPPADHQIFKFVSGVFLFFPSGEAFRRTPLEGVRAGGSGTAHARRKGRPMDDNDIIQTPDGPMTWAAWKKKNPIQTPSRRTKGKKLPNKVKLFTDR